MLLSAVAGTGTLVEHKFTLLNIGNVALQSPVLTAGVDLRGLPDLTNITCAPVLGALFNVSQTAACQGWHTLTQKELEAGFSAPRPVSLGSTNIDAVTRRSFAYEIALKRVELPSSQAVVFEIPGCQAPTHAGEAVTCSVLYQNNGTLRFSTVDIPGANCTTLPLASPLNPGERVTCEVSWRASAVSDVHCRLLKVAVDDV